MPIQGLELHVLPVRSGGTLLVESIGKQWND